MEIFVGKLVILKTLSFIDVYEWLVQGCQINTTQFLFIWLKREFVWDFLLYSLTRHIYNLFYM